MSTERIEGGWYYDPSMRGFAYTPPGVYETGTVITPSKYLSEREARQLVEVLEQEGYIKPRLDERLRTEDLKITHRLLDLLEKGMSD